MKTQTRRLTPLVLLLGAVGFSGYEYVTTGKVTWIERAYQTVMGYPNRPDAAWRKAAVAIEGLGERREAVPGDFDIEGRVVGVSDGDTITVLDGDRNHQIRLFGIDTPERGQPHYRQASAALAKKISEANIAVSLVDTDRFGRRVGIIYLGDRHINLEMVREGHAWWYRKYARYDRPLQDAEQQARRQQLGLWSYPDPVPPWEWKRQQLQ